MQIWIFEIWESRSANLGIIAQYLRINIILDLGILVSFQRLAWLHLDITRLEIRDLRIKISQFGCYYTIFDQKHDLRFDIWESRSASFVIITLYLTRNMTWDLIFGNFSVIAKVGLASFTQYMPGDKRFENQDKPIWLL